MPPVENSAMPPVSPIQTPLKSKRMWWILGSIGAVLVLIVVLALGGGSKEKTATNSGEVSSVTGADLLTEKPNAQAVSYQGVPVVQACNVLSLNDLKKAHLALFPNESAMGGAAALERNYFNGQGTAKITGGNRDALNNCRYKLKGIESIELGVFQEAYVESADIQSELERYTPTADINGVKTYKHDGGAISASSKIAMEEYIFQFNRTYVRVQFDYKSDGALGTARPELLAAIAANAKQQVAAPTGPATIAYAASAFPESIANACDISSAADFAAVFNTAPMPEVTEAFATKIGTIYFNDDPKKVRYPYLRHECIRRLTVQVPLGGLSIPRDKEFQVEATTYLSDEASKKEMGFRKKVVQTKAPSSSISDEAYVITVGRPGFGKPGMVAFRKGRIVVKVSFVDPLNPRTEESNLDQSPALEKAAAQIAVRLKGF